MAPIKPKPAPEGYCYTGIASRQSSNYVDQVRQMCEEGGDLKWKPGKQYPDAVCLKFTDEDLLQMWWNLYEKYPSMNSEKGIQIANYLEFETRKAWSSGRQMHDPKLCAPLYNLVMRIKRHAEKEDYQAALREVEGLMLALSNAPENGLDQWRYMEGDICLDIAGLMMVALAHVLLTIPQPDPDTPEGMCFDSVLSRLTDLGCPGDEPEDYEKYEPKVRHLAAQRKEIAKVSIWCGEKNDEASQDMTCSFKALSSACDSFSAQYGNILK